MYLYAPSRAYGHPDDFRALVDEAHGHGLAVILDVVYNHFGPDGNYLGLYIGDYCDEGAKTPWGGAIRYGEPAFRPLREWVVENPSYWMREYHIDGFRLDATHAIADHSSRHILAELTAAIHQHGGFAIAEDSRNSSRLLLNEELGGYNFDGVWADDFHHTTRVANTGERQSYFGDFEGSAAELLETLKHGWFYRGQYSRRKESRRGTECRHVPPEKFVHCISNHDQVGNSPFGKRLSAVISPAAYRAASALLCLTPYTPMLFMGQEWATSAPFLFFTDHHKELGKLVTEGRREEFRDFEAFSNPVTRQSIPDPQAAATFERSKLYWDELARQPHSAVLELYRTFLGLRRSYKAFRPRSRSEWQLEELTSGVGVMRLKDVDGDWLVVFDLVGEGDGKFDMKGILHLEENRRWNVVVSSNESRFGGNGNTALNLRRSSVTFSAPEESFFERPVTRGSPRAHRTPIRRPPPALSTEACVAPRSVIVQIASLLAPWPPAKNPSRSRRSEFTNMPLLSDRTSDRFPGLPACLCWMQPIRFPGRDHPQGGRMHAINER